MTERCSRILWLVLGANLAVAWNPDIIYGISPGEESSIRELGQWILLLSPMFLSAGRIFGEEWKYRYLTAIRYGNCRRWWNRIWYRILILQLAYTGFLAFAGRRSSIGPTENYLFLILLLLHMQFLFWFAIFLYLKGLDLPIAVLTALLTEGISLLIPVREWWTVGSWGMYNFSDLYHMGGLDAWMICGIQILLLMAVWFWAIRKRMDYDRVC